MPQIKLSTDSCAISTSCVIFRRQAGNNMQMLLLNKHFLLAVLVTVAAAMTTGCQTYAHKNRVIVYWRSGDIPAAVTEAKKRVEKSGPNGRDMVIWTLEEGATLRALGDYQESNAAFDRAQTRMDEFAEKAKVSISRETGALLSNQANLPYEGRAYDGIMLNTYRALNFLALDQPENARP